MSEQFTYWPADPTPIFGEPRFAVGVWGPRYIVQGDETDVRVLVDALNAHARPSRLPKPAHESFTREPDGSCTCNDCGQRYSRMGGPAMRSHRRNVHGEEHRIPGVCDA